MRIIRLRLLLFLAAGWCMIAAAAPQTFLPFGSAWRYFDSGSLPDPNWFQTNYTDGHWKNAAAQFGYGEGDESTLLGFGPDPFAKFVTTYFRASFQVADPAAFTSVTFLVRRDPGVVVYLNGSELLRDNMPEQPESIVNGTYALTCLNPPVENALVTNIFPATLLRAGTNYIAVELHQCSPSAADLSFDLSVIGNDNPIVRGPYLQVGTSSNIIVRWRTSIPTSARVRYGTELSNLDQFVEVITLTTEHEILLTNLTPATKYFYDIGSTSQVFAGDDSYFFHSAPTPGSALPVRIWAIGDFGNGSAAQREVRDAFMNFSVVQRADVWLMLGDNAYCCGTDDEYQRYVFEIYPSLLRQTVVWPTVGNHDTAQSTALSDSFPYYQIFSMPTNAEAGGLASGSEHYYSFDYANIHFVCLDSMTTILRAPNSAMLNWLRADLAANTRDWVIAYWHHPPYTKGSHDSDDEGELIEMRRNVLPILEDYGVDLVLAGHSHCYERSHLIDGHYGLSQFITPANFLDAGDGREDGNGAYMKPAGGLGEHRGTVYIVDGSSGGQGGGGTLDHPVMFYSTLTPGSLVVDVEGQRLDGWFLTASGVLDRFTVDKRNVTNVLPRIEITRADTNAVLRWPTSVPDYVLQSKGSVNTSEVWTMTGAAIATNGRRKTVTLPSNPGTNRFFRLQRVP